MAGVNLYVSFDVRGLKPPAGVLTVISTCPAGSSGDIAVIELGELTVTLADLIGGFASVALPLPRR